MTLEQDNLEEIIVCGGNSAKNFFLTYATYLDILSSALYYRSVTNIIRTDTLALLFTYCLTLLLIALKFECYNASFALKMQSTYFI